jgi:hypothetical protein
MGCAIFWANSSQTHLSVILAVYISSPDWLNWFLNKQKNLQKYGKKKLPQNRKSKQPNFLTDIDTDWAGECLELNSNTRHSLQGAAATDPARQPFQAGWPDEHVKKISKNVDQIIISHN